MRESYLKRDEENIQMKNVILVHSYNGDTRDSFAPFIEKKCVEHNIPFHMPSFPVRSEASFEKWKDVMDRYEITEETVIIAHSLGTLFVPKYAAEKNISFDTYISVAGYLHYQGREDLEILNRQFEPDMKDFEKCRELIQHRYSVFSDYDRMNPEERLRAYAEALGSETVIVKGAGHFDPSSGVREIPLPAGIFD